MTTDAIEPGTSDQPGMARKLFGPTLDAVVAPGRAFELLDERPKLAVWPLVWILAGMGLLGMWTLETTRRIMRVGMIERMARQGQQQDPEQVRQMLEGMDRFVWIGVMSGTLFILVSVLVVAGVLWMGASLFGGRAGFARSFGVASVSAVIHPLLYTAFVSIMWKLDPPEIRRMQDVFVARPSLGLDLLVDVGDPTSFLHTALSRIDLFNLWWVAVAVIGAERLLRLKRGVAVGLVVGIWLVSTAASAAWTAMSA